MRHTWNGEGISQVVPSSHEWVTLWYFLVHLHTEKTFFPHKPPTLACWVRLSSRHKCRYPITELLRDRQEHTVSWMCNNLSFKLVLASSDGCWLVLRDVSCITLWYFCMNHLLFGFAALKIVNGSLKVCDLFYLLFSFSKSTSRKWRGILWMCVEVSEWERKLPAYPQAKHLFGSPPANGRYGWVCSLKP